MNKPKPKTQAKPGTKKAQAKKTPFMNTFAGQMVMIFIAVAAILFLPTTSILMVGMLPTMAAFLFGLRGNSSRAYCVAATNLVGCFIFILDLWAGGHTLERAMEIIINPVSLIIMYCAAAVGYFIDWFFSNMMAGVIQIRAKGRLSVIRERQQALIEQWGQKVTGTIPLDNEGFPIARD